MSTELVRSSLAGQMGAALAMLRDAVERCPDALWEAPVGKQPFWMVAYHVAFYADLYLTSHMDAYGGQPVWAWPHAAGLGHQMQPPFEPLRDDERGPVLERRCIVQYLDDTIVKMKRVLAQETDETLAGESGFFWYPINRVSMHLLNLRHVQHHAGQLCAVLRREGVSVDWVG